jgi:hypothetical protein
MLEVVIAGMMVIRVQNSFVMVRQLDDRLSEVLLNSL